MAHTTIGGVPEAFQRLPANTSPALKSILFRFSGTYCRTGEAADHVHLQELRPGRWTHLLAERLPPRQRRFCRGGGQDRLVVAAFEIEHSVGLQAGLRQRWREEGPDGYPPFDEPFPSRRKFRVHYAN